MTPTQVRDQIITIFRKHPELPHRIVASRLAGKFEFAELQQELRKYEIEVDITPMLSDPPHIEVSYAGNIFLNVKCKEGQSPGDALVIAFAEII